MNATKTKKTAASGFADAIANLSPGIDAVFSVDRLEVSLLSLDEIDIREQVRTLFDDTDDNKLSELAESIKAFGVVQPILVRPMGARYELVAGERRVRASRLAGLQQIPAMIKAVADADFEDVQFAENVQRENLAQIDLAKKLRRDMDAHGGDMEAVAKQHKKSVAWVSKWLGLLTLPPETARLVTESVSADVEVIGLVKQVEKRDKKAAAELVDELKRTRGKVDARATAKAARDVVKPSKAAAPKPAGDKSTTVATAPDRRIEQPSAGTTVNARAVLSKTSARIDAGERTEAVLAALDDAETSVLVAELRAPFDAGRKSKNMARDVLQGLRVGAFAPDGHAGLLLAAFLRGAEAVGSGDFRLDQILNAARP